jgi:hypothetical protein
MLKSSSQPKNAGRPQQAEETIVTYTSRSLHETALPHFERHLKRPCTIREIGGTLASMMRHGGDWGKTDKLVYAMTEDDGKVLFAYEGRVIRDSDGVIFLMMDICDPDALADDGGKGEDLQDPAASEAGNQSIH